MPLTHIRSFRVRHYECDAFGHLNNTNYVRYMQETAFDASAAAGYDQERYRQMGVQWLIHATEIEYLQPVYFGDTVEVKTWVADFRKVSSRRAYEITLAKSGELAARGFSDWAFLEAGSGKPAMIPAELANGFFPEGQPKTFPPRPPFWKTPPAPAGAFKVRLRVAWQDIDTIQHANNAVYLEYIEECAMQVIAAYGWPVQRMLAEGCAVLIRQHQIEYLLPALLDDELEILTWVSNVRRSTAIRHYLITRVSDGVLLARVNSLGVWTDLASGRPVRFSPQFLADFAPNLTGS
jgi:acyl-CoA thioester hydrolase